MASEGELRNLTYDVIIIGSGVTGALIAYELAKEKVRVLVLEAGGTPSEFGHRKLLIKNYAASSSKGQDSPYTDETRLSKYYSSPPSVAAPQAEDERIEQDQLYYTYDLDKPNNNQLFKSFYERVVGGALSHWQGISPRMLPNDFKLKSTYFTDPAEAAKYPDVRDWPISYYDLAPYYDQAEREMGIFGNRTDDIWLDTYYRINGPKGKRGYPEGFESGVAATYLDKYVAHKLGDDFYFEDAAPGGGAPVKIPIRVTRIPQAKNAIPYDGRPACSGQGTCVPLCPTRAKYEAVFHIEKAVEAGAELHANAVVTQLKFDTSSGEVTSVEYKDWANRSRSVRGRIIVLAANAIESPRLLLNSYRLHSDPQQFNKNDLIGKYLMDHPGTSSYGLVPDPVYPHRGPTSTSHIETTRDGRFRTWRAGFKTSLLTYGWPAGGIRGLSWDKSWSPELTEHDRKEDRGGNVLDLVHNNQMIGTKLRDKLRHHVHRQVVLGTALEQLPVKKNAVKLNTKGEKDRFEVPLPQFSYDYDDPNGYTNKGLQVARRLHEAIFKRLGATTYRLFAFNQQGSLDGPGFFGAGHIMGTTRMGGKDEKNESVVDEHCLSWDHRNLYVVGSSVFVTGAVANPTPTIAALSLRAARRIKERLDRGA
jgi:choline dehydrogenase-like flavoprotein